MEIDGEELQLRPLSICLPIHQVTKVRSTYQHVSPVSVPVQRASPQMCSHVSVIGLQVGAFASSQPQSLLRKLVTFPTLYSNCISIGSTQFFRIRYLQGILTSSLVIYLQHVSNVSLPEQIPITAKMTTNICGRVTVWNVWGARAILATVGPAFQFEHSLPSLLREERNIR